MELGKEDAPKGNPSLRLERFINKYVTDELKIFHIFNLLTVAYNWILTDSLFSLVRYYTDICTVSANTRWEKLKKRNSWRKSTLLQSLLFPSVLLFYSITLRICSVPFRDYTEKNFSKKTRIPLSTHSWLDIAARINLLTRLLTLRLHLLKNARRELYLLWLFPPFSVNESLSRHLSRLYETIVFYPTTNIDKNLVL